MYSASFGEGALISAGSAAGNVDPFMVVYGNSPSSSRLSVSTPFGPICITARWKNWTVNPLNVISRAGEAERLHAATPLEELPEVVVGDPISVSTKKRGSFC